MDKTKCVNAVVTCKMGEYTASLLVGPNGVYQVCVLRLRDVIGQG